MNIKPIIVHSISLLAVVALGLAACNMTTTPVIPPSGGIQTSGQATSPSNGSGVTGSGQPTSPVAPHLPTLDQVTINNILFASTPLPPPAPGEEMTATPAPGEEMTATPVSGQEMTATPVPGQDTTAIPGSPNLVPYVYHFNNTPGMGTATPSATYDFSQISSETILWNGSVPAWDDSHGWTTNLDLMDCNQPTEVDSYSATITTNAATSFSYLWSAMILYQNPDDSWTQQVVAKGNQIPISFSSASTKTVYQDVPFMLGCGGYMIAFWLDFNGDNGPAGFIASYINIGANISTVTPVVWSSPTPTSVTIQLPTLILLRPTLPRLIHLPTDTYTPTPTQVILHRPTLPIIRPTIPRIILLPTDTPTPVPTLRIIRPTIIRP